ncbi:hypothetical protein GOODEAATRI_000129 [Goodea atripinnis]|uniref:Uncharacterized protein n=1 Tax=Goodea atripinnis TaxID=208336 RepID=A0ABV0MN42_9TELE
MILVSRGSSSMSLVCGVCRLISKPRSHLNDGAQRPRSLHTLPLFSSTHPSELSLFISPIHAPDPDILDDDQGTRFRLGACDVSWNRDLCGTYIRR